MFDKQCLIVCQSLKDKNNEHFENSKSQQESENLCKICETSQFLSREV